MNPKFTNFTKQVLATKSLKLISEKPKEWL